MQFLTRCLLLGYELLRTSQPCSQGPLLPGSSERGWTNLKLLRVERGEWGRVGNLENFKQPTIPTGTRSRRWRRRERSGRNLIINVLCRWFRLLVRRSRRGSADYFIQVFISVIIEFFTVGLVHGLVLSLSCVSVM